VYTVNGDNEPYIDHTMDYVRRANNLSMADVKKWNMTMAQAIKKL
jgi:hypothetical protein